MYLPLPFVASLPPPLTYPPQWLSPLPLPLTLPPPLPPPPPPPPPAYCMHTASGYGYGPTHFTPEPPPLSEDIMNRWRDNTSSTSTEPIPAPVTNPSSSTDPQELPAESTVDDGVDATSEQTRALYLGNICNEATYYDLCRLANQFGPLESVNMVPTQSGAFINFIYETHAKEFFDKHCEASFQLGAKPLHVSWAKAAPLSEELKAAVKAGATRNLFIGNLASSVTDDYLVMIFAHYGNIENMVRIAEKKIAFINMTDIKCALLAKEALDGLDFNGRRIKVGFGKEGIICPPTNLTTQIQAYRNSCDLLPTNDLTPSPSSFLPFGYLIPPPPMPSFPTIPETVSRSLYIGNVPAGVTYHDICKIANRFGGLEQVNLVPAKSCAFFNFIESQAAQAMYHASQQGQITLRNRQIRVNWAKSGPLCKEVRNAIYNEQASRCLFIGQVSATTTEAMLRERFSSFGEIDSITVLHKKGIAFVNMTSIKAALSAREHLNGAECEGQYWEINFAKEASAAHSLPSQMVQNNIPFIEFPSTPPTGPPIPWIPPLASLPEEVADLTTPPSSTNDDPHTPVVNISITVDTSSTVCLQLAVEAQSTYASFIGSKEDVADAQPSSRAVLIFGMTPNIPYHDICLVANRFGGLDSVQTSASSGMCLVTFIEPACALAMFNQFQNKQLFIRGRLLRVAWGPSCPVTDEHLALIRAGASRNLWVGGVAAGVTEHMLYQLFIAYGEFDSIVIIRDKGIAFVNLTSLSAALAARTALQGAIILGQPIKINFAKEAIRNAAIYRNYV